MMTAITEKSFGEEVLSSPVPVLVSFWAPWCGPCRLIDPLLNQLQQRCNVMLKVARVNADDNFWLAKTYGIKNVPTLMLFHEGSEIFRLDNLAGREDFLTSMQSVLARLSLPSA